MIIDNEFGVPESGVAQMSHICVRESSYLDLQVTLTLHIKHVWLHSL